MAKKEKAEEKANHSELVPIFVLGKKYEVPASLTIQKAMEFAGFQWIRGCGCRGGICGACGTVYRFPDNYKIEVGLACQTVVQPNMYITQIPFFPAIKKAYDLEKLSPSLETLVKVYPETLKLSPSLETLVKVYPETLRCLQCNTCTKSCPMDIEVMDYMAAAMRGDIARVAELSFDCVMCGLCTARCPAEICQYNMAILARRLYGKYMAPRADHLRVAVEKIEAGHHDSMIEELMGMDENTLKKLYTERQMEPEEAGEEWTPDDTAHL